MTMDIVIVGAGNLATSLAHALYNAGHAIKAVFSRTIDHATELANKVHAIPYDDISRLPADADVYIVAVKDDVISQVAKELRICSPNAFIVHTAGTVSVEVLPKGRRGVFYPMQTFSKQRIVEFSHIPLFLEAEHTDDEQLLDIIASSISDQIFHIKGEKRKVLHLAAVFCCNFANHCAAIADNILSENGIPFSVMVPLIDETVAKLHQCTPLQAQTGPAVRNDLNVIRQHIEQLKNNGHKDFADIYDILSKSVINLHQSTEKR